MKKKSIRQWPENERPREKLVKYGASSLSTAEILAILLGSGAEGQSAIALAERILSLDKDGIRFLSRCQPEELCRVPGVGPAKASSLVAAVELGRRVSAAEAVTRPTVYGSDDVAGMVMEEMRYFTREVFRVVYLNVKNQVMGVEDIAIGGQNVAYVQPRELFANAIRKGAAAVVLIHNHPSGNPEPSDSDFALTRKLLKAGDLLGIHIADHLVIGNGVYRSILAEMPEKESS